MRDVIARIVDGSRFREFKKEYGSTIVTVSAHKHRATTMFVTSTSRDLRIYMAIQLASLQTTASYSLNLL